MKATFSVICYFVAALIVFAFSMWLRQMYLVGGGVREAFSMAVSLGWEGITYVTICLLGVVGFAWLGLRLSDPD